MIARLPIRVRLTLPFALAMALVLAAMGVFIYVRVGSELLASTDQALSAQVTESLSHVAEGNGHLVDPDASVGPTIAQLDFANGSTSRSDPVLLPALVTGSTLQRALTRPLTVTRRIAGLKHEWRLRTQPVRIAGQPAALVIGRSLEARDETLRRLGRDFLIAAPAALLLAILAGYGLAAAALRPVEAMRRRAEAVTASTPGRRLPVPPARDEIAALALTLNAMLARLEAAFEHERRFVADASHELRTPLALLRTELEVALRRPRSHDELEAALRSAAEETERLVLLSEDLLLIARADEGGGLPLRRERVAAADVLERVRTRFAGRASALGRTVRVEPASELIVDADPARLEQALSNLVDNALHHGSGPVTLSAQQSNGHVELHVTDEGNGFPPEFVQRAFDRFSRADESRSARGTGLGLSIVTLIATAHGGRARAENGPDGGADVWLEL